MCAGFLKTLQSCAIGDAANVLVTVSGNIDDLENKAAGILSCNERERERDRMILSFYSDFFIYLQRGSPAINLSVCIPSV